MSERCGCFLGGDFRSATAREGAARRASHFRLPFLFSFHHRFYSRSKRPEFKFLEQSFYLCKVKIIAPFLCWQSKSYRRITTNGGKHLGEKRFFLAIFQKLDNTRLYSRFNKFFFTSFSFSFFQNLINIFN